MTIDRQPVVRLDDLTPAQRRLVLALVEAGRAAGKTETAGPGDAEPTSAGRNQANGPRSTS
jgi:hypothetical protein